MNRVYSMLLCVLLTVASMLLWRLGSDWMELGYGLNPKIAFPWIGMNVMTLLWVLHDQYDEYKRRQHALGEWTMRGFK